MEERKENRMGTMPVGKLLVTMSLPIMISMLIQALYNIVDSIFVAQIGENALTAVSLAFPVQNLIIAVGIGTGIGINSLLSRRLGERRFDDANAAAENGILLSLCNWLVFAIFGGLFSEAFFRAFTENPEIISMGTDYLTVCTVFSFGCFMQFACERILQATGITIYNMITQATGAIINIILDPIMIFGLFGFPRLGVKGAAIATVIGQIVAMLMGLWFNAKKNKEVHMDFRHFRPNGRIIGEIYKVGVPSIVMQSIGTVMTIGMNKILIAFSETAVAVFGVYFKLQSFVFMPIFGLTNGLVPIVAYNYGARKRTRITASIRLALVYALSIMALGLLIFQLFPVPLLRLFKASDALLSIGVPALRIISISFLGAGVGIVLSSVFQAMGNGVLSLTMSVARQLAVLLPVAWLMARFVGLDAVWAAFPVSEYVSVTIALFMYRYVYHNHIATLADEA
ncbi:MULTISPECIES: MATE family efflux transporter [Anaerotruncus]|uniref:Probable multidrug resistance protein NorM n=3 Tax=Anaerotruncus TaxID=244127 RepID=A0A498CZP9_9FIRM|nr:MULTISPECIES: MATE family efflux transporter [Anaerotruncus]MBC3938411.1 MATE family efflux transporter [Anaerotruncus massiliensis (ex Togo et al. 2019)]MCQ4896097.1 MATE family efflux transporter [Anaerotruncus sp. DFI.9.16]RLL12467.1 MATE family efflux transporter [Anaerotruncus massiliensis (ex Liu et al. 2021)]GKH46585.1 MATE family efflux transporter [Oscillospiraceae bacterium]